MNTAIVSGILKGEIRDLPNGSANFTLVTAGYKGRIDEFEITAFKNTADFIRHQGKSGQRVVVAGRLESDKLGSEVYHTVIAANRILSVGSSEEGSDYAYASVGGEASSQGAVTSQGGTTYNRINLKTTRVWANSDGEALEFTTYVNGTLWEEDAYAFPAGNGLPATVSGFLTPNTYEKDGHTVKTLNISIQDFIVGNGAGGAASTATTQAPAAKATPTPIPPAPAPPRYKTVDGDAPF